MNNLNTVLIEGQLTKDPILVPSPAQTQMCRMSLANNRYYLDKDGNWKQNPSYFTVHVYGPVASACVSRLKKGRGVRVVGRLNQYSWKDQGFWHEKISIIAEHIEFQPVKKSEPMPESKRESDEFTTKSNLHGIEDLTADDAPLDVPETQIQEDESMAVPECIIESEDKDEAETEEDFDQASGF